MQNASGMSHPLSLVPSPLRAAPTPRAGVCRLLVVSARAEDAAAFAALGHAGAADAHEIVVEQRLATAPHRMSAEAFDAVVVSADALDPAGLATLTRLTELVPETPVLVLASTDEPRQTVRAIRSGAQDVLLRSELTLPRLLRAIACGRERAARFTELRDLSLTDPLTQLCNRRGFLLLAETHARHLRRTRRQSLLLFADVDG
jgi:PleD family two-component response regulator